MEIEITMWKMASYLLVIWFVAWTPYAALCIWGMLFESRGMLPIFGIIPAVCAKASAAVNAMLYGLR